jgi:hypothetical protein
LNLEAFSFTQLLYSKLETSYCPETSRYNTCTTNELILVGMGLPLSLQLLHRVVAGVQPEPEPETQMKNQPRVDSNTTHSNKVRRSSRTLSISSFWIQALTIGATFMNPKLVTDTIKPAEKPLKMATKSGTKSMTQEATMKGFNEKAYFDIRAN